MNKIKFLDKNGTFTLSSPENYSYLYFPVANDCGIKSSVTPNLGGDIKSGQNTFLMEPVSSENLHNNRSTRNFWIKSGDVIWSATGSSAAQEAARFNGSQDKSSVTAGFMWHTLERECETLNLKSTITSFAPLDTAAEIMYVELENTGDKELTFRPTAAIPMFCRSADNIRDHRHVTSLLNRLSTSEYGVNVKPTLSFDERGHQINHVSYYVCGVEADGKTPVDFYPTSEILLGEGGTYTNPASVYFDSEGVAAGTSIEGGEAVGGIRFEMKTLKPGEKAGYTIIMGITEDPTSIYPTIGDYNSAAKVAAALDKVKAHWTDAVNVSYYTGNEAFDGFMKWVSFQPILRRIYGCSFLPHHDYGRGGRGWRDLWQDCLSLLIMDPSGVRQMILDNYGGVRVDGTNATIIGEKQGEFIADRNGIARVWMDHGMWPFMTTKLYINQTGDVDILRESATYFKDEQKERGTALDKEWSEGYGVKHRTKPGEFYHGTILEHILLEQLCAFYEVGEHNHYRLRGADWNDALDMAAENGESIAFTCAYAGNMSDIADMLLVLRDKYGWKTVTLLKEMEILLKSGDALYDSVSAKTALLSEYLVSCGHTVSGETIDVDITALAENLREKAEWVYKHVRETEWIESSSDSGTEGWFNSYYDNSKNKVEGFFQSSVRMMLTGQVFSIMSGTASEEQIAKICKSADTYLYKPEVGGYRLNTNFHEVKHDLGRAFGFSYGDKENGAVFSHMTVMYANALYRRGFVAEGYKALQTLADTSMNFDTSRIYPGVPEYFNANGRGMYHYLTGAASWYMLTFITEAFGVKGEYGDLIVAPKLVPTQYDENGKASLSLLFDDKSFTVNVINKAKKSYGEYAVSTAECDGQPMTIADGKALLSKSAIDAMSNGIHTITVELV